MPRAHYKIGDKVIIKVVDKICKNYKNKIGKITLTDRIKQGFSDHWDYEVTFDEGFTYPFAPEEIRSLVNTQLLFDFMG